MQAGFLSALDKDQAEMFIPSELRLYQHAQEHRLLTRDILAFLFYLVISLINP